LIVLPSGADTTSCVVIDRPSDDATSSVSRESYNASIFSRSAIALGLLEISSSRSRLSMSSSDVTGTLRSAHLTRGIEPPILGDVRHAQRPSPTAPRC
jgi:hypothetical protein